MTPDSALFGNSYSNAVFLFLFSYATMEKAESKRRITTNLFLVAFCGLGSMYVVHKVKKNLQNETVENIYVQNSKRYQQESKEKS